MPPRGRRPDPEDDVPPPGFGRSGTRALGVAENVVYAGIVVFLVFLVSAAGLLLALAGRSTWQAVTSSTSKGCSGSSTCSCCSPWPPSCCGARSLERRSSAGGSVR